MQPPLARGRQRWGCSYLFHDITRIQAPPLRYRQVVNPILASDVVSRSGRAHLPIGVQCLRLGKKCSLSCDPHARMWWPTCHRTENVPWKRRERRRRSVSVLDDPAPCGDQLAAKATALYCVFGKSRAGFAAKKLNGRSWKECHMVGITGQSSTRGTW